MKKIVCLLAILLIAAAHANAQFVNAKTVSIKAVAVKTGKKPEGAVIDITVTITPGNGKVFVSTSPYTEIDMQGSAQLAALTACDLLGLDFMKYDFFYEIRAETPIVGGPSAGAVMTVATIAALKNLSIKRDVFMTGMIYPDGYVGPVGGIPYKLEAAAKNKAKVFLIPKGQRIVYVEETVEKQKGPFIIVYTRTKPVDLVEYGKSLGVEVVEVSTIDEALWYYTGYMISKSKPQINLSKYSDLLKMLAFRMKNETLKLLETVKEFGVSDEAMKLIRDGDEYFEKGYYYTATSKYYQAKIELRKTYYSRTIKDLNDLNREFDRIGDEIDKMTKYLKELENKTLGIESFQIIGGSEERLAWAETYLFDAKTSNDRSSAIEYLSLAKERLESVKVWLSLLKTIKEDVLIDREELKKRAEFYLREARSLIVYAESINGYRSLISQAEESLDVAERLFNTGFYSGAATACIDSIVKSSLAVEIIAPSDVFKELLKSKVESSKKSAEFSLAEAEKIVTPILSIAYYEFAKNQESPVSALIYYKLCERLAKLILFVSEAYPKRELVKVEYPPITPSKGREIVSVERIKRIDIPGFESILAISAIVSSYAYARFLRRRNG